METQPVRRFSRRKFAIVSAMIIIVVVAAFSVLILWNQYRGSCVFEAIPGPTYLRVISDSNQTPIVGAQITATDTVLLCNGATIDRPETQRFVTNSTEWYPMAGGLAATYSFVVSYAGHTYSFSTGNAIEAATCATLFIPSGRTNVTFATSFQMTCSPTTSTTATSCVQLESEPLDFIIRNSTNRSPISAVPVQVNESTPLDPCSPNGSNSTKDLGILDTNANGTIQVCCTGSTFFFSVAYLGRNYQVNSTAEGAESVQCVTLYIPSAVTNTTFGPPLQGHC